MKIHDLSQLITPDMPVFPGSKQPMFESVGKLAADGFRERLLTVSSHTGTHIDVPAHILDQGKTLELMPLDSFYGRAVCLDFSSFQAPRKIELGDLQPYRRAVAGADFVLLHTGWSKYWGTSEYFTNYPVLADEAARWLGEIPIRGVGVDAISVDGIDSGDLPVHHALLGREIIIVENLTNLSLVLQKTFTFSCLPLKFTAMDGSPVRAVALIE